MNKPSQPCCQTKHSQNIRSQNITDLSTIMSSSSESEDENLKQFAAAVDTSLFNNEFYKPKDENDKKKVEEPKKELKSQRYLENTENIFQSELNVSENMKQFIGKKMSKLIEESIEFIDVKNRINDDPEENCVKLLKGSSEYLTLEVSSDNIQQHKVPIKRRKVDNDEDLKESTKVKEASTDIDKISQEVSQWDERNRHKVFKYKKGKDGNCHKIEEPNEFSKSRSKNGWSESKIKSAKYFNKGLCSIINQK